MYFDDFIQERSAESQFHLIEAAILAGNNADFDKIISSVDGFDFSDSLENGETLLMIAVKKGNHYAVARLLSLPNFPVLETDATGSMAFDYAVASGNSLILNRLIHSADSVQRDHYSNALNRIQNQEDQTVRDAKELLNNVQPRLQLTGGASSATAVPTVTPATGLLVPSQRLQIINSVNAFFQNPYQNQGPELNLSNTALRSGYLAFAARQLQKPNVAQITWLDLSNNKVIETRLASFRYITNVSDYDGINALSALLSKGSLQHLNLSNCGLDDTAVKYLIDVITPTQASTPNQSLPPTQVLKNLRVLNLSDNTDITDFSIRALGQTIFNHPDTGAFSLTVEDCALNEDTQMFLHRTKTDRLITDIERFINDLKNGIRPNNLQKDEIEKKLAIYLNPTLLTQNGIVFDEFDAALDGIPTNGELPELLEDAKRTFQDACKDALSPTLINEAHAAIEQRDSQALFEALTKHLDIKASHAIFHELFAELTDATLALALIAFTSLPINTTTLKKRPQQAVTATPPTNPIRETFLDVLLTHQKTQNKKRFESVLDSVVLKLYEDTQGKMSLAAARILPPERLSLSFKKCVTLLNHPISKSREKIIQSLELWRDGLIASGSTAQFILDLLQAIAVPSSKMAANLSVAAPPVIASSFGLLFAATIVEVVKNYLAQRERKIKAAGFIAKAQKALNEKWASTETFAIVFSEMFIKRHAEILVTLNEKQSNALIARFVELFSLSEKLSPLQFKEKFDEQFDLTALQKQIIDSNTGKVRLPQKISAVDFIDMLIHVITTPNAITEETTPQDKVLGSTPLYLPTANANERWRHAAGQSSDDLSWARVARVAPKPALYPPIPQPHQDIQPAGTLWYSRLHAPLHDYRNLETHLTHKRIRVMEQRMAQMEGRLAQAEQGTAQVEQGPNAQHTASSSSRQRLTLTKTC